MIIVYTDTDQPEMQVFPLPGDGWSSSRPFIEVIGVDAERAVSGDPWTLSSDKKSIRFLSEGEQDGVALEQERDHMVVSAAQAFIAMDVMGFLETFEAAVANSDRATQLAFAKAQTFRRRSPLLVQKAQELNIADTTLDELFRYAATVVI